MYTRRKEYLFERYQLNTGLEQELTNQIQAYKRHMLLIGDLWRKVGSIGPDIPCVEFTSSTQEKPWIQE